MYQQNYILWKSQFESFLSGQGLLGFVTGSISAPAQTRPVTHNNATSEEPNPEFYTWHQTDQVVKSWLLGSFAEDILSVVVNCFTSHQVWMTLANHFNRVSSSRLFELQRRLQTLEKKDNTMEAFLKDLKHICDQLASVGNPVPEKMKIFSALNGLGREYEPIKTTIENSVDSTPTLSLDEVASKLRGYDDRLQSYVTETSISPHVAFNVTHSENDYFRNNRGRGRSNSNCGRSSFSTRGRGFHQQISSGSQSGNSSLVCQICGKAGHHALKCWHRFDNSYQHETRCRLSSHTKFEGVYQQHNSESCHF